MQNVDQQKIRLEQKKNRLVAEEVRLKIKERKMRTRHLIEIGGLIIKAELEHLAANTLYGALLSLKNDLTKNSAVQEKWTKLGKDAFDKEQKEKVAIILTLDVKPEQEIRSHIRRHGLKWNHLRQEWYGYVTNMQSLKDGLHQVKYNIEVISS